MRHADKQTFEVRFGIRHVEATFTVAANGFGWHQTFTSSKEVFNSWGSVTAWCSAPGTALYRSQQHPSAGLGVYDLEPADLVTIVDEYFRKYVPEGRFLREALAHAGTVVDNTPTKRGLGGRCASPIGSLNGRDQIHETVHA